MTDRRRSLQGLALAATSLAASALGFSRGASAATPGTTTAAVSGPAAMQTRAIPATGERLPVIGMGTADSFNVGPEGLDPLREVIRRFFAGGATVIDTAPSYGRAEAVVGELLAESGLRSRAFIATKLGTQGRESGLAQFEASLKLLRTDRVELLQVHNLRDWKTQAALIQTLKAEGRVKYSGLTHYTEGAQEDLAEAVRAAKPDFLQINYSVGARAAEKTLFPLARDQGVAVLVNRAFEDGRLFGRVRDRALPAWAAEVGIGSWAQAFLRFVLSEPAVTSVIPATSRPDRQSDNLLAGHGPMLSAAQRQSLVDLVG